MITILGSTGFVGSALLRKLAEQGRTVTGLSRPQFELGDSRTYSSIPVETEILVHSAGPAGPEHSEERYWKECVKATYDLVEFINRERENIKLLAYVSSGAVYIPRTEALTADSPTGPGNLYGMTRLLSETIISSKCRCRNVIFRLFFPYGPGQKPPRLIPELIRKVQTGETVTLNGDEGCPVINPVFIDDLAESIAELIADPEKHIYNLGGSEPVTIRRLVEIIGGELRLEPVFDVNGNTAANLFCNVKKPSATSLKTGLARMIQDNSDV